MGSIGVDYDGAMLSFPENTTYSYPDSKFNQQWHKKVRLSEIQLIESVAGDQLKKLGYALSNLPPKTISQWEEKCLLLQDWWYRFNFRRKRYGNLLFLVDFTARRFPFLFDRTIIQEQITQIDIQDLK